MYKENLETIDLLRGDVEQGLPPDGQPEPCYGPLTWEEEIFGKTYTLSMSWESITTLQAQQLIANQVGQQRTISNPKVENYVESINNKEWISSMTPIQICHTGELLDGQHRLVAIARAEVPSMKCLVQRGLPEECSPYFDQGRPRSMQVVLTSASIPNSSEMTATVKLIYSLYKGSSTPPRNELGKRIIEDNPSLISIVKEAKALKYDTHITTSILATVYYVCASMYGVEITQEFFRILKNGGETRDNANHPITRLYRRLQKEWNALQRAKDASTLLGGAQGGTWRRQLLAWIYQSFLAFEADKSLKALALNNEVEKFVDDLSQRLRENLIVNYGREEIG